MRLNLDVVPFSEPAQSTPNAVLIYNHANRGTLLDVVQGTESTTHSPRMVDDNNYAHTPILCDVPMHMKCNYAVSHIQVKTHIFLLECLHAKDENVSHPVPCPESLPTPSHAYAKCENRHLCSINDHFSKTKAFCFISQNPLGKLRYSLVFIKSRVFLWVANFRGLTAGVARLPTLSQTFIAGYTCPTKNTGFFTRGGIYPFLLYPTHVFFISFFFYATVRLILYVVPFTEPTQSNTKHSVDFQLCTHTHLMRCPRAYAMQDVIACHVTCIMNATWTTQSTSLTDVMDNHITCI